MASCSVSTSCRAASSALSCPAASSRWSANQKDLPEFKKIKIKYGFEGFDERNIFPYRNFSRFEREFELKLRFISKFESKEAGHLGSLCSLV
jgi:hypothetical protein